MILMRMLLAAFARKYTRFPKIVVPFLCDNYGGTVDSIISTSTLLHKSVFNLEFETLFVSSWHMVADLWERKGKISGCFKNSTSLLFFSNDKIKLVLKERTLESY